MSTLKVNTIQNTSGVEVYTTKAWVSFNGTGTISILSSGNVSSITDLGVGQYQVNFATALPANYAFTGMTGIGTNGAIYMTGARSQGVDGIRTTTECSFGTGAAHASGIGMTQYDATYVSAQFIA